MPNDMYPAFEQTMLEGNPRVAIKGIRNEEDTMPLSGAKLAALAESDPNLQALANEHEAKRIGVIAHHRGFSAAMAMVVFNANRATNAPDFDRAVGIKPQGKDVAVQAHVQRQVMGSKKRARQERKRQKGLRP